MQILFITSEFHPLAKSGGLADAVASLAKALVARGHRVNVVLPRYQALDLSGYRDLRIPVGVPLGHREEWIGVYHRDLDGVELYCLDHRSLFDRPGIYGPSPITPYGDNLRRYALLSRGALQLALALHWTPDIIHAHDWPTALVPIYHSLRYSRSPLATARTVFSIHNFGYQGWYPVAQHTEIGLFRDELERSGVLERDSLNLVRGALRTADRIVAVSPRYAREIQTAEYGFGLHRDAQARAHDLTGILNGIDEDEWDPSLDQDIPARFSRSDRTGKEACKHSLQREFGLVRDPAIPLVGMVTRLTEQKGIGALFGPGYGSLYRICTELPLQFILLGSGEEWCEREIRLLSERLPNFSAIIGYSDVLAHRIEAGSDFFLMPSTYEPCGLNQMYSMRYGTIPIVTQTGGLADTVDEETGFLVSHYSPEGIFSATQRAISTYLANRNRIQQMQAVGMARDFSWNRSAREYEDLYRSTPGNPAGRYDGAGEPHDA